MDNRSGSLVHATQPLSSCSVLDVVATQILAGNSILLIDEDKRQLDDYVLPLCKLVDRNRVPKTLVLVATRRRLLELFEEFQKQLGGRADISFLDGQPDTDSELLLLRNGFLLATTAQMSAVSPTDVHWDCLVLDELERLQAYGGSCFQELKLKLFRPRPWTQLLVTTRLWLEAEMNQLLPQAKQPLLLFRAPLEAAFYGGLELKVQLGDSLEQQLHQLKNYLKLRPCENQRTLIYCAKEADLKALQQHLPQDVCLLHRGRRDIARIEQWRRQQTGKVLLLRSQAPELKLDSVECLIHFNMPPTWNQFRKRFVVLQKQIPNRLKPSAAARQQLQTLVLLDKQSQQMLPQLIECLQQHGQQIDDTLVAAHAELQASREATLVARQCVICPVLLLYGRCMTPTCQYRHLLSDIDRNCVTVPTAGFIRFQLLKICTPSHFAARLVATRATAEANWQTLPVQQSYLDMQQQLSSYYATPENSITPTLHQLQEICVRRMPNNCYERVSVTFVPPAASTATAEQYRKLSVRVKHLDLNTVICHEKLSELLVCPLGLQQVQALALDVRLAGLVPLNGEEIWQCSDLKLVDELLHPGGIYEASVLSALSHSIFVSNLQVESVDYVEQLQRQCLGKFDVGVMDCLKNLVGVVKI